MSQEVLPVKLPPEHPARARYRVRHDTIYRYSSLVSSCYQLTHLKPRQTPWQSVLEHHIEVLPGPEEAGNGKDYFGNDVYRFAVQSPHDQLMVRSESLVDVLSHLPLDSDIPWEASCAGRGLDPGMVDLDLAQYRAASPMVPLLEESRTYAQSSFAPKRRWLDAMLDLTRRIHADFQYDPETTTITTQVFEVLRSRQGVCQDFAHLMCSCLRSLGIPARYVSGYVLNRAADGAGLAGADASHAWAAAHCPTLGWVAFDPTNGKLADLEFVTLGWGREFFDVTPIRGVVLGSSTQELSVAVQVEPLAP
jgi:transglutaminase-like putative cysteine protease